MTNVTDIAATVTRVRHHYSTARTIKRNLRLGRYDGRNTEATSRTLIHHEVGGASQLMTLPPVLQGLLTEEDQLATRLSEARDAAPAYYPKDQVRPELRDRLNHTRRLIKGLTR